MNLKSRDRTISVFFNDNYHLENTSIFILSIVASVLFAFGYTWFSILNNKY